MYINSKNPSCYYNEGQPLMQQLWSKDSPRVANTRQNRNPKQTEVGQSMNRLDEGRQDQTVNIAQIKKL